MTTYRITKFDTAHRCDAMLLADGSGWTLHADKAAAFPTLTAAVHVLVTHVQDRWPNACVARG